MNCSNCQSPLPKQTVFCPACGHLNEPALPKFTENKVATSASIPYKWYRAQEGKWFGGVCSGLAHKYKISVLWVRLGALILSTISGLPLRIWMSPTTEYYQPRNVGLTEILIGFLLNYLVPIAYIVFWLRFPLVRTTTGERVSTLILHDT